MEERIDWQEVTSIPPFTPLFMLFKGRRTEEEVGVWDGNRWTWYVTGDPVREEVTHWAFIPSLRGRY